MMCPLVRELAADGIPVVVTCRVLGFTPPGLLQVEARPVSDRDWSDAHLVHAARQIHADDPAFGYRFIADERASERGVTASENWVQRLCSAHGIFSVLARKKGRRPRPGEPVHEDLVRRAFGARGPNELRASSPRCRRSSPISLQAGAARARRVPGSRLGEATLAWQGMWGSPLGRFPRGNPVVFSVGTERPSTRPRRETRHACPTRRP